jgi:hypothetical protein
VVLSCDGVEIEGWSLNVSRGGVRVVIEERLAVGDRVDIRLGGSAIARPGRVAWAKVAPDGQILGLQFLDASGSVPPADDLE